MFPGRAGSSNGKAPTVMMYSSAPMDQTSTALASYFSSAIGRGPSAECQVVDSAIISGAM